VTEDYIQVELHAYDADGARAHATQKRVVRQIGDGDHRITVRFQQLEQTIELDHPRPAH
jgi:hypothetical protein